MYLQQQHLMAALCLEEPAPNLISLRLLTAWGPLPSFHTLAVLASARHVVLSIAIRMRYSQSVHWITSPLRMHVVLRKYSPVSSFASAYLCLVVGRSTSQTSVDKHPAILFQRLHMSLQVQQLVLVALQQLLVLP